MDLPDEGKYATVARVTEENIRFLSESLHAAYVKVGWTWIGELRPGVEAARIERKMREFMSMKDHPLPSGKPCACVSSGGLRIKFDGEGCLLQVQLPLKEAMDDC